MADDCTGDCSYEQALLEIRQQTITVMGVYGTRDNGKDERPIYEIMGV